MAETNWHKVAANDQNCWMCDSFPEWAHCLWMLEEKWSPLLLKSWRRVSFLNDKSLKSKKVMCAVLFPPFGKNVLTSLGMVSSWVLAWLLASRPAAEHRKQTEREEGRKRTENRVGTLREWTALKNCLGYWPVAFLCHWKVWLHPEQSRRTLHKTPTTWQLQFYNCVI